MFLIQMNAEELAAPGMHRHQANPSRELAATPERSKNIPSFLHGAVLLRDEIKREFTLAAARDCIVQSLLVWCENPDALSATRDRDIPLLSV